MICSSPGTVSRSSLGKVKKETKKEERVLMDDSKQILWPTESWLNTSSVFCTKDLEVRRSKIKNDPFSISNWKYYRTYNHQNSIVRENKLFFKKPLL